MKCVVTAVRVGQVWEYRRREPRVLAPVVHVVTRVEGDEGESVSVFTCDGYVNVRCVLSGRGCEGRGLRSMLSGGDGVGTWRLLYEPPEEVRLGGASRSVSWWMKVWGHRFEGAPLPYCPSRIVCASCGMTMTSGVGGLRDIEMAGAVITCEDVKDRSRIAGWTLP